MFQPVLVVAGVPCAGWSGAPDGVGGATWQSGSEPQEGGTAVCSEVAQGQQWLHDAWTLVRHDDR